jgi:NADH-quinone oxidoreductase subunit M
VLFDFPLLTLLLVVPLVGSLLVYLLDFSPRTTRWFAVAISLIPLALSTLLLLGFLVPDLVAFVTSRSVAPYSGYERTYYAFERLEWIPQIGATYVLGVDALSVALVFLTTLLTTLALVFMWDETKRVPEMYAMFLFMEVTILGVFVSLDLLLFFIFWEVGLVPMYFIIAVWGGPRKRYASLKFFFYTFAAGIFVLLGIFALRMATGTFDMAAIVEANPVFEPLVAALVFVAFFVGFGTKLPTVPFHTWLPDAHVEAPTAGSVILAGILLKLGGYALIRFNVQMLFDTAVAMWWLFAGLGILSILYGAVVCLAQDDLKRLVAYSSVSHMGFVTLGIGAAVYATQLGATKAFGANLAMGGAIFQMFAHGLVSAALFMVAGAVGHKIGTRKISELGGVSKGAPVLTTFLMVSFLASLGLPGLVGFVAELTVFLGTYNAFGLWVVVPLATVVLTAAYYIYAAQRAFFGPPNDALPAFEDAHAYETVPLAVLVALFALFGIAPFLLFDILLGWSSGILGV